MSLSVTTSGISQTSFTATVRLSGSVPMQCDWYLNGSWYASGQTVIGQTASSCIFMSLSPGTRYSVTVRVYAFNPWRELDSGSTSATTLSSGGGGGTGGGGDTGGGDTGGGGDTRRRPSNFYWSSDVSRGENIAITARDWNDFIDRIGEFADYLGVRLNSADLLSASVSRGGTMYAYQANAARNLIAQLGPPTSPPSRVLSGDVITAQFFLDLRGSLNSIR